MKAKWVVLLLLLLVLFTGAAGVYIIWRLMAARPEIAQDTVIELELEGEIHEGPASDPIEAMLRGHALSLYDMRQLLQHASKDSRIRAVLIKVKPLAAGWGAIEELRDAIGQFKRSGKKVYALIGNDFVEEKEYYMASVADKIYLNPESGVLLNGLIAEVAFLRKALEKLKIEPQFLQLKEYKAAAEPLSREHMSEYFRENLDSLLTDIFDRFVKSVVDGRKLDEATVRSLIETGMFVPRKAKEAGLVDELGYKDAVEGELSVTGKDGKKEYRSISASKYLQQARDGFDLGARRKIALIFATGAISAGKSEPVMEVMGGETVAGYIRDARKDSSIKAIVMRVNSPGGSAVGSDLVWREIQVARKDKPVVVSMSSVAGSGGYYISMGADAIVCQPSTLTGSIGVVFGKLNMRGLYEWLGINIDTVKKGRNADILSPFASMDQEQQSRVKEWMEEIYEAFKRKAAEGRGMSPEKVEPIARGRVWTGKQAKSLGLVDELGGLDKAIAIAKGKAGIGPEERIQIVVFPKKKSLWDALSEWDLILARIFDGANHAFSIEMLRKTFPMLFHPQPCLLMPDINIY